MRVLLVHKTKVGGVAVHVSYLKKYLKEFGYDVKEITRNEDLGLTSFAKSYFKLKKLYKEWEREFDIIHAHDWSIAYPAVRAGIKNLVVTLHGLPTNPLAKYFEDYVVKKLKKKVIVISPFMLKYYPEATYIPNGVDLNLFKDKKIGRDKNLVGIAQKYNKEKIKKIAEKVGFKVICTEGKLRYEDLPKFYSKVGIFVSIPYKQAGFNMVWLEAMSCEVPYIVGTNVGIGEILPIYKVKNLKELEIILREIKEEKVPPLKGLREWIIRNNLTWENHVQKLIDIYKQVWESQ